MYTILTFTIIASAWRLYKHFHIAGTRSFRNYAVTGYQVSDSAWFVGYNLAIGAILALAMSYFVPRQMEPTAHATLVALHSGATSSSFIIASSTVRSVSRYHFLVRNEDGSATPGHVEANNRVRIFENTDLKDAGYWVTITSECKQTAASNWILCFNPVVTHEFHVPPSAVQHSYQVH